MQEQLTGLIVQRINDAKDDLKKAFFQEHPIKVARHFALDNLLPNDLAKRIYADFPKPGKMRSLKSSGECKLKFGQLKNTSALIQDINYAIQDPRVIAAIEDITGIQKQQPDPLMSAGGITTLLKGGFINPHLDNSHDVDKKLYRAVNVLYYLSPNWRLENGGNYELWDTSVKNRIIVPSLFNRLLVMETNRSSWHAVNPVLVDEPRCCVFNYFFSEQSPEGEDYFNVTAFQARPEQKIRRAIASVKNVFGALNKAACKKTHAAFSKAQ
ncbi:MAG: 2OG-Fe(II) oxygenase [Legionellales bacterium]